MSLRKRWMFSDVFSGEWTVHKYYNEDKTIEEDMAERLEKGWKELETSESNKRIFSNDGTFYEIRLEYVWD